MAITAARNEAPQAAQRVAHDYACTALVLQGGGALGAYQAGVVQALDEAGIHASWVAGISIGALNAAIIAGNPAEKRVEQLKAFWERICTPPPWFAAAPLWFDGRNLPVALQSGLSGVAAMSSLMFGQHGFFRPRVPPPFLAMHETPATTSWYDTQPLRKTLLELADFERINDARSMRVSIGAVNVRTGNFTYFDNTREQLRPEHFMASGALPPGFPAVEIDGEYYWDGGVVSNTPLYKVLRETPRRDMLVFQVDLWSARGELPRDLAEVEQRGKEIQYSSRTRAVTEAMHQERDRRHLLNDLLKLVPEDKRDDPAYRRAAAEACDTRVNLVHLIYRDRAYEGHYKDYEFSTASMRGHWHSGLADMRHTLDHPHWLDAPTAENPFVTHDVHRVD